ncbi:hypothetical protein [Planctomicrobium sp. SH527]|uniref:hypothetical protein n=1 Tax=Planctomicrobium sp. SH527 TaxID=3448123 RepID=UPI003F5CB1D2
MRRHAGRQPISLGPGRYTIGSGEQCHIVLPETGVASRHCTLVVGEFQNIVKAWSPLTWINDGVLTEGSLRIGDRLIVGPVEFRVAQRDAEATNSQRVPASPKLDSEALLSEALFGKSPRQTGDVRRKEQLEELLSAVQAALNDVLERERVVRDNLTHDRMILSHRNEELSQQWELLNDARARLLAAAPQGAEDETRHSEAERELAQFQRLLDDRHAELARRATEQTRIHRLLKFRINDFNQRQDGLASQLSEIENREIGCRNLLARNDAQFRQLKSRTVDLDRREEEIHRRLAGIAELTRQSEVQALNFKQEQEQWNQVSENRKNLLDELEQTLLFRAQSIGEEESQLAILKDEIGEQKKTLDAQVASVEQRAKANESVSGELRLRELKLENELQTLEALRGAFAQEQAELAQSQLRLEEADLELKEQFARFSSKVTEFQAREQKLSQRESELQIQLEKLQESQRNFQLNEQQRTSEHVTEADRLNRELQRIAVQRDELKTEALRIEQLKSELESRTLSLDAQSEQIRLREERVATQEAEFQEKQARRLQLQEDQQLNSAELQKSLSELAAQKMELEQEREAVEIRQAEIDAEQQNFVRLRSEIAAERSRDEYDREQLQIRRQLLDQEQEGLSKIQQELEALREQLNQERTEFKFLTESRALEQQESEQQTRQLESSQNEINAALEEKLGHAEAAKSQLESELTQLRRQLADMQQASVVLNAKFEEQRSTLGDRDRALVDLQVQLQQLEEQANYLTSESEDPVRTSFDKRGIGDVEEDEPGHRDDFDVEDLPVSPLLRSLFKSNSTDQQCSLNVRETGEHHDEESGESGHQLDDADEKALQLRSQLASLFGLDSKTESHENGNEPRESALDDRAEVLRETVLPQQSQSTQVESSAAEDDGDLGIEQYMQLLLARSRPGGQDVPEVIKAASSNYVSTGQAKVVSHEEKEDFGEEAPAPARRTRKLVSGEKESIRADIHSFRELANYSARTAVAVSRVKRRSAQGHVMMGISVVGWIATAALLAGVFALRLPLLPEAGITGGVSFLLTCLASIRIWEAKQMAALPALNLGKSASSDGVADVSPESGEFGNDAC